MKKSIKEIEVKAGVENFVEIIKQLESLGCQLSDPVVQDDTVYFPEGIGVNDFKEGVNAARIRLENGTATFTIKQRQDATLANIEKEVDISDAKVMDEILKLLGFYEFIRVSKVRRVCHYKEYEICLDEIADLGKFIEIEKMTDEPAETVQEELFQFLEKLGIKRESRAVRGYDVLLYRRQRSK